MKSNIPDFHKEMERDKHRSVKTMKRREWIKYSLFGGTGVLGSAGYLSFEAQWIEVNKREIMLKAMHPKASFKLLHLSDLHLSNVVSLEYLTEALKIEIIPNPARVCNYRRFCNRSTKRAGSNGLRQHS